MTKKLTAQQKANQKWVKKNRAHHNYLTYRSIARGFIRKHATKEDLLELQGLIEENFKKFEENA